jgi:hypothetical protein
MLDSEAIDAQLLLPQTCHRTLWHFLRQKALLGDDYASPAVLNGIDDLRNQIRNIKQDLRFWGADIDNLSGDEVLPVLLPIAFPLVNRQTNTLRIFIGYKRHIQTNRLHTKSMMPCYTPAMRCLSITRAISALIDPLLSSVALSRGRSLYHAYSPLESPLLV